MRDYPQKKQRAERQGEGQKMGLNMLGLMALVCCIFVILINEKLLHLQAFQISLCISPSPLLLYVCYLNVERLIFFFFGYLGS